METLVYLDAQSCERQVKVIYEMLIIGLQRAVLSGVLQLAPDTEMVSAGPEGRQGARAEVGVVGYEAWLYVVAKS